MMSGDGKSRIKNTACGGMCLDEFLMTAMRRVSAIFLLLTCAGVFTASAQIAEYDLSCTFESKSDLLKGLRANEYCGNGIIDYSTVSRYISLLDDSFWERAWVMAVYWRELRNPELAGEELEPFRRVEIPYRLENWAHDDRRTLNARSNELMAHMGLSHGFLEDPDLQAYVDTQLKVVVPNPMVSGRPGAFEIKVLKSLEANAYALSTGTLIVTTGLLSAIETEDELRAILAHEVAHVYLDHQISSFREAERRRAWSAVIGAVAGAVFSEIVWQASAGLPIDTRLWLSVGVDVASRYMTAEVIESIGLRYSRVQEREADQLSQLWLMEHGANPEALVSVFKKARFDTMETTGSHPSARSRHLHVRSLASDIYGSDVESTSLPADTTFMAATVMATIQQAEISLSKGRIDDARAFAQKAMNVAPPRQAGAAAFVAAKAARISGDVGEHLHSLLALAESSESIPFPYLEIERGLALADMGSAQAARSSFEKARSAMTGDRTYSTQMKDWVDQVLTMLDRAP